MNKIVRFLLPGIFLTACISDFSPDTAIYNAEKIPVVYSLLNPDSLLSIDLFWSNQDIDSGQNSRIMDAEILLFQDTQLILDTLWDRDTTLILDFYPKVNATYDLEVNVPGQERISAHTIIPEKPNVIVTIQDNPDTLYSLNIVHHLEFIDTGMRRRPIWIVERVYNTIDVPRQVKYIYSDATMTDDVNKAADPLNHFIPGFHYVYEGFLRISGEVIHPSDTISYMPLINAQPDISHITTCIVSVSEAYDRYSRSAYMQRLYSNELDIENPLIYQPVRVISNVKNGFGVFAGYNINEIIVYSRNR